MSSALRCVFLSAGPDVVCDILGPNQVIALRRRYRGLGDGFAISRITLSSPSIGCRLGVAGCHSYAGPGSVLAYVDWLGMSAKAQRARHSSNSIQCHRIQHWRIP